MKRLPALWLAMACLLMVAAGRAPAREAVELADDPRVEQRLVVIAEEMRCLVCQNESLAASRSDLALDLRRELRTLIKAGRTDAEIREFMVSRYGDFVLYRPVVKPQTWLLWAGPFVLMIGAVITLLVFLARRRRAQAAPALSEDETRRAQALLNENQA